VLVSLTTGATAAGPGGWDHVGDGGSAGTRALNGAVAAFNTDVPGVLLVGGSFKDAGGIADADHIAAWNGTAWSALGPSPLNGAVNAIAQNGGRVFAGGVFTDAGGNPNADYLAVWDGSSWASFCGGVGGNVTSMQIVGPTLYVGGTFQNGAGIATADYLLACDLGTGSASSPFAVDGHGSGAVYALTADSNGNLYAAGTFINLAGNAAADYVAYLDAGGWHSMGTGPGSGGGAVTGISRALGASGTDVYLGTDGEDVAGIPQADNMAKWNGSAWSAMGANAAGSDGWFPPATSITAITTFGSQVFAGGSFQNADGDPLADEIASFDGSAWHPVGSDGAGDGPLSANVLALRTFGDQLFAGGGFTVAGGDPLASFAATFPLTAGPAPLPPPVQGESVNAVAEKGTVLVKLPGSAAGARGRGTGFVSLDTIGRQIPVGATLDTKKGTVLLSAARNAAGATQDGHISQGVFRVQQSRKSPLTTLSMTGGGLSRCSKLPRGGAAKVGAAARKRSRRLFTNVRGRFRTRGRNSTATVRGTSYLVKDTCAGTLTKVKTGKVTVRDLTLRRTKTVKAGRSYLARAPKRRG
jgi:hypothetical protein